MKLKLAGQDILGKEDAARLRQELNMDELDRSNEEITLTIDKRITGISTGFGLDFLRPSAHNIWGDADLESFSISIEKHGESYSHELIFPPYKFVPEDETPEVKTNFYRVVHRMLGCICAIYADMEWETDQKTEQMHNKPEEDEPNAP